MREANAADRLRRTRPVRSGWRQTASPNVGSAQSPEQVNECWPRSTFAATNASAKPQVGEVSQKSAAGAPVPSAEGPGRAQTGFRWSARTGPDEKSVVSAFDRRSAGVKTEMSVNVEASGYLYTIAAVGMAFAGLSVLTMILRQILGGQMTKFDTFVARSWVQLGFMVTFGSILPPLLGLLEVSTPVVWRISSGLMAIILGWWALTFPRRRLVTKSTRLPVPVIIFSAALDIVAIALAANTIAVPVEYLPGVYVASVTAILVGAAMLFLFAFAHWYDVVL